jgi:hypothetical protein
MPTLAMPEAAQPWSLTSLREKLIKIGAKVVSHGQELGVCFTPAAWRTRGHALATTQRCLYFPGSVLP